MSDRTADVIALDKVADYALAQIIKNLSAR